MGANEFVYAPAGWITWQETLNQEDVMGVSMGLLPCSDASSISWFLKGACSSTPGGPPSAVSSEALQCISSHSRLKSREHVVESLEVEDTELMSFSCQSCQL